MLMSMNVFQHTNPKLLSFPSASFHGRRTPHSSSFHALVSSPATVKFNPKFLHFHGIQHSSCKPVLASHATMGFNPKSLHFLPCHGFSRSSCKPVLGSPATIKYSAVLFALPRDNEDYSSDNEVEPIIQANDEEYRSSVSSDTVNVEQSKKVSGGEVMKLEFVVREVKPTDYVQFWASAWLKAGEFSDDSNLSKIRKHAEQEFQIMLALHENLASQPFMCIVAVKGENMCDGSFKSVIGTLDFHIHHREPYPKKHGIISNVVVDKSARQQGVGSSMLKYVIDSAKESGIPHIFLHVRRDNKQALALYKKMGFTE